MKCAVFGASWLCGGIAVALQQADEGRAWEQSILESRCNMRKEIRKNS